eukprot:237914_1
MATTSNSNSFLSQRALIKSLVSEKKHSAAYDVLLQLLSHCRNDYVLLSQLGYVSYQMECYDDALTYYRQCIDIHENEIVNSFVSNWFCYYQYAKLLHLHLHNYIAAKRYYIKSLKLNADNIAIYRDIAKLYLDTANYAESATYFEQYFSLIGHARKDKLAHNLDAVHYEYAQLLWHKLDRKTNAKSHIQRAIALKPKNATYQFEFALMLRATQSFKKAKKCLIQCIELTHWKNDRYLYCYGLFVTEVLKDPKQGMFYVKKALDLAPQTEEYKNEFIALKKWNDYQFKSQKKCYAKVINTKPNTKAHQREIYNSIKRDARRIKFEDGTHSPSPIDWDKICGSNNKYSSRILEFKSKFKIACQAQAEHNYDLAKSILEDLIKIAPEDGEIFGRYAFALAQLNILSAAERYYKKSLMLSPRNYVTMYNYAFLLYYKLKRYHKAELLYKKCLKIKPNCAKALLNYARLLDTIKEKARSEQYYRMCLSGSPNYDLCFYYFGCFLYRQERYEEAKHFLQKAVDCWPHSHLHHFRLAVTCHILCEYDKCAHHLKEALRIKPDFEAAMEAFERYGYGQIHQNGKNGRLVFSHYKRQNQHYKNANRFGKYYVKKTQPPPPQPPPPQEESDDTSNAATTETDLEEEETQHLRMYDPVRRNHRFNIDEKWPNTSDDNKYFVNWLKSIRLYEEVRHVFADHGIDTMKAFHAQIPSKDSLSAMLRHNKPQMISIIWNSAPKL